MSSDMVRIRIGVNVRYLAGSRIEDVTVCPRDEWEAMSPKARETELRAAALSVLDSYVDVWAYADGYAQGFANNLERAWQYLAESKGE